MKNIIFCAVLFCCLSCTKDADDNELLPTGLVLNLRQSVLGIGQVDSADVVFRKTGTGQTVNAKFSKHADVLSASLNNLSPGTWNADIEVYTKAVDRQSKQYKIIKSILITNEKADVEIAGPATTPGNGWFRRTVKASAGNEVVVIVPDDVYDPYFEFRAKTNTRYAFGIERVAIKNNYLVAQKTWFCVNDCLDDQRQFVDVDHFRPFTQTVLSQPWTRNEINIAVFNTDDELILEYDKTWEQ